MCCSFLLFEKTSCACRVLIHDDSSDIQTAFTEAFAGIEKLIEGQVEKVKKQVLTITVSFPPISSAYSWG